jgi:hypothetical protein
MIGPESTTLAGTLLTIFSKIVKQILSKDVAVDIARIVTLLSEENIRKSELVVILGPTTKGPPLKPVLVRYSLTPLLSNIAGVLSNVLRLSVLIC